MESMKINLYYYLSFFIAVIIVFIKYVLCPAEKGNECTYQSIELNTEHEVDAHIPEY
jgi:hypothetical protein